MAAKTFGMLILSHQLWRNLSLYLCMPVAKASRRGMELTTLSPTRPCYWRRRQRPITKITRMTYPSYSSKPVNPSTDKAPATPGHAHLQGESISNTHAGEASRMGHNNRAKFAEGRDHSAENAPALVSSFVTHSDFSALA